MLHNLVEECQIPVKEDAAHSVFFLFEDLVLLLLPDAQTACHVLIADFEDLCGQSGRRIVMGRLERLDRQEQNVVGFLV